MSIFDHILKNNNLKPDDYEKPSSETLPIKGTVIKVNSEKGWAFVISDSPEWKFTRFFLFWTALPPTINIKDLVKGQQVEFVPIDFVDPDGVKKGWRATRVRLIP